MGSAPGAKRKTDKADFPNVEMDSPRQFKRVVQNIHSFHNSVPEHVRHEAADWYPKVNEAVAKGIRGTSTSMEQGAGLVAAVSPAMDWEKRNIDALGELHSLRERHWKQIAAGDRSSLAGMSISQADTRNLGKAHRILQGEDIDTVLNRRTAPKTNSFAHNILLDNQHVTIDGRAHDIGANRMQPWEMDRGIGSAALVSGKPTRYEHFENAYRAAASSINEEHGTSLEPFQIQSITWEGGKAHERSGLTKAGQPRKQGAMRIGQKYV